MSRAFKTHRSSSHKNLKNVARSCVESAYTLNTCSRLIAFLTKTLKMLLAHALSQHTTRLPHDISSFFEKQTSKW